MKITLKNYLMNYLKTGNNMRKLIFIGILLLCSCGEDFDARIVDFSYTISNQSNQNLVIDVYDTYTQTKYKGITLNKGTYYQSDTSFYESDQFWSVSNFLGGDSVVIKFDDGKELLYKCLQEGQGCSEARNIFNDYTSTRTETDNLVEILYSYEITESDYLNAQ